MRQIWLVAVGAALFAGASVQVIAAELPSALERQIDFARDVKPLLAKHCWSCHGEELQESGLRLDRRQSILNGGDMGRVVVLGRSADSRLIHYIAATDPKKIMPPEGDRLSAESVGILRAWIDQGCVWPESASAPETKNSHWAFNHCESHRCPP